MIGFWQAHKGLRDRILIPKYYDPSIAASRIGLEDKCELLRLGNLVEDGVLSVATGDEIGKAAYGTGDIPFVRTSDIANWETKSAPKQGVSEAIFSEYATKQDVRTGDILFVRDGTYLIGTNCFVTRLDRRMLYQSHILKIRVLESEKLDPHLLFLALNSASVRRQIRSFQFTADTIDTIGKRYLDLVLALPKGDENRKRYVSQCAQALSDRMLGKAFVKQAPILLEDALRSNDGSFIEDFAKTPIDEIEVDLRQDTISAEFGHFETFWHRTDHVKNRILLPKYYDPEIVDELSLLAENCDCKAISELIEEGTLAVTTGDEIGKMAYGTGSIPFIRTSDFANWEIKHDPKQGVSEAIYQEYCTAQDLKAEDILLVRDGTYLVGTSCMVTEEDAKALFCGGLFKIRSNNHEELDPYLLLGLLNSYIVKRQIRTKQFTRDVIDTLGKRLNEVIIPIPRSSALRVSIARTVKGVIGSRINARKRISELAASLDQVEIAGKQLAPEG